MDSPAYTNAQSSDPTAPLPPLKNWDVKNAICLRHKKRHSSFTKQTSDFTSLQGQSPQIYTVSHVWTFEFQFFLSFGYATFQHKSQ